LLTVVVFILILFWDENTGDHKAESSTASNKDAENISFFKSVQLSGKIIAKNPAILCLGLSQAFFEGAVYSFGKVSVS
jgi:hypothetical protein